MLGGSETLPPGRQQAAIEGATGAASPGTPYCPQYKEHGDELGEKRSDVDAIGEPNAGVYENVIYNDQCCQHEARPRSYQQKKHGQRIEERQRRPESCVKRMDATVVPPKAVLKQDACIIPGCACEANCV